MTIKSNKTSRSLYTEGDESSYDLENITLTTDYTPADQNSASVACRGFVILGATGTVKIDTPAGTTITIPSGLAVGVVHPIAFTKLYSASTAVTLLALS